jgi:hypothetical protein
MVNVGDLPLTFWIVETPTTVTPYSGWTTLATLTPPSPGNVYTLNVQKGPAATTAGQSYTGGITWGVTNPAGIGVALSVNSSEYDFTSQEFLESIATGTTTGTTGVPKSSQEFLETIGQDTALARSSQEFIELVIPLYVRVSQDVAELVASDTPNVRTSQLWLDVLFSSQGQRRRVIDDELITY